MTTCLPRICLNTGVLMGAESIRRQALVWVRARGLPSRHTLFRQWGAAGGRCLNRGNEPIAHMVEHPLTRCPSHELGRWWGVKHSRCAADSSYSLADIVYSLPECPPLGAPGLEDGRMVIVAVNCRVEFQEGVGNCVAVCRVQRSEYLRAVRGYEPTVATER